MYWRICSRCEKQMIFPGQKISGKMVNSRNFLKLSKLDLSREGMFPGKNIFNLSDYVWKGMPTLV